jgi:hypothetical protein
MWTSFWKDVIEKEMRNVLMAFKFRDDNVMQPGFKKINCHTVFDVKLDLVRKARFVAGGHQTDQPKELVYSSVVSRDSVRLAFLIAALNDLEILSADVQNAYLNMPTMEKIYVIAGPEFGQGKEGWPVMIVRALYGLRSSGACWHDHLAATLWEASFNSCKVDADMWMRPAVKADGSKCCEYVLCYLTVIDILVVSNQPKRIMEGLEAKYMLKAGSAGGPMTYLGAKVSNYRLEHSSNPDKVPWSLSAEDYVNRAVKDVETELEKVGKALLTKVTTPTNADYCPELDQSKTLGLDQATYFAGLIGILHWRIKLGRIDINVEVSLLSRFLTYPREGHLQQVFPVFGFLKKHARSWMVFDETMPAINQSLFWVVDWSE